MFTASLDTAVFATTFSGPTIASPSPVHQLIGTTLKSSLGLFDYHGIRVGGEGMVKGRSLISRGRAGVREGVAVGVLEA